MSEGFNTFIVGQGAAGALTGAELAPIIQSGGTVKSTVGGIQAFGSLFTLVAASGVSNNVNPGAGWPSSLGRVRLNVDTTAGNAEFTGLVAAADGQEVLITNIGANLLQLDNANAGSTTANQFKSPGSSLIVVPNGRTLAVYYGSVSLWFIG